MARDKRTKSKDPNQNPRMQKRKSGVSSFWLVCMNIGLAVHGMQHDQCNPMPEERCSSSEIVTSCGRGDGDWHSGHLLAQAWRPALLPMSWAVICGVIPSPGHVTPRGGGAKVRLPPRTGPHIHQRGQPNVKQASLTKPKHNRSPKKAACLGSPSVLRLTEHLQTTDTAAVSEQCTHFLSGNSTKRTQSHTKNHPTPGAHMQRHTT